MGHLHIEAERNETALPLELVVNQGGGVTGLTCLVALRDAATANSWLDFNDVTFKTAGWVTRQAALAEVSAINAPGQYRLVVDLSAVTNLPASPARLIAEYDVSGAVVGNALDTIVLKEHLFNVAIVGDAMAVVPGGITAVEAPALANLDATVSSAVAAITVLNDLNAADVQAAMTAQGYTPARAALLDNLDAAISTINSAISALNDLSTGDVQTAMTTQGYTAARALLLDNLDSAISSIATAVGALNDLSTGGVQTALTSQGYTTARAPNLDNLDATVSGVPAAADAVLTAAHGVGAWTGGAGLSAQAVRDAMKLAPTVGAPAAGSVDEALDAIETDTAAIEPLVTTNLDAPTSSIITSIGALNNLSVADVQTALTAQGFTTERALELSEILDHVKNRLEIDFTVTPRQLVLYDRTGTAEIHRWDLDTDAGEAVQTQFGVQTKRGVPA